MRKLLLAVLVVPALAFAAPSATPGKTPAKHAKLKRHAKKGAKTTTAPKAKSGYDLKTNQKI